jgi:hypothetical protein
MFWKKQNLIWLSFAQLVKSSFPALLILALHLPGAAPPGIGHDGDCNVATGPVGLQQAGETLLSSATKSPVGSRGAVVMRFHWPRSHPD